LDWYEGIPADEAADIESEGGWYCSRAAMRKVRRLNDRDPETGEQVEPLESAVKICVKLRNEGLSQRKIAAHLGISKTTVQRRLEMADDQTRRIAA
jgi:DNA-binding NarL/FixJ family response regulator